MQSDTRPENGESRRVSFGGLANKLLLISTIVDDILNCGNLARIRPCSLIVYGAIFFVLAGKQGRGPEMEKKLDVETLYKISKTLVENGDGGKEVVIRADTSSGEWEYTRIDEITLEKAGVLTIVQGGKIHA